MFNISCKFDGHPPPSYTILHNHTKIVSTYNTYTIDIVQYADAGVYECIAHNVLGSSSKIYHLSIIGMKYLPLLLPLVIILIIGIHVYRPFIAHYMTYKNLCIHLKI